jgi:hypothetical protein
MKMTLQLAFSPSACNWRGPLLCYAIKEQTPVTPGDTKVNTLTTKLTAFAAALMVNGLVFGAVGYLFAQQAQPRLPAIAFAHKVVAHQWLS